jgi:hypothetical protein
MSDRIPHPSIGNPTERATVYTHPEALSQGGRLVGFANLRGEG